MKALLLLIGTTLCLAGPARAEDQPQPPSQGDFQEPPMPAGLEEFAKKNNLALPSDIKKALDACRAEGADFTCVNEKLAQAGFNVPPLPPGAKELSECVKKAKAGANADEDTKACLAKHAPKPPGDLPAPGKQEEKKQSSNSTSAA